MEWIMRLIWAHWLMRRQQAGLHPKEQCLACLKPSLVVLFNSPAGTCSAFHIALVLPVLSRYQAVKSDSCSLWPQGLARPVLAPGILASYLISDPGFFCIQQCFPENIEQKLTDRINFHCRFNSQLISLELHTLPPITTTVLFQKLNFRISERHLGAILESCHW